MNVKFMQTVDRSIYTVMKIVAQSRGVTVQELLRAVIIPDWMKDSSGKEPKERARTRAGKLPN